MDEDPQYKYHCIFRMSLSTYIYLYEHDNTYLWYWNSYVYSRDSQAHCLNDGCLSQWARVTCFRTCLVQVLDHIVSLKMVDTIGNTHKKGNLLMGLVTFYELQKLILDHQCPWKQIDMDLHLSNLGTCKNLHKWQAHMKTWHGFIVPSSFKRGRGVLFLWATKT